jgi:hypothetical protein
VGLKTDQDPRLHAEWAPMKGLSNYRREDSTQREREREKERSMLVGHEHQDTLPEWSKGVDSSSTSASCVGSNPTGVMCTHSRGEQYLVMLV